MSAVATSFPGEVPASALAHGSYLAGPRSCIQALRTTRIHTERENQMGRQAAVVLYVLALVAVVVGVDILFFRHHFWARLIVNVGIVLVFAAFGLRFLKRP